MASRGSKASSATGRDLFVDRQAELALISRRLEDARTGQGCLIVISGEPGIGKTRLAEAAAEAARKKGFSVFWGQCHDGQYIPPYWPWKQLLRGLLELLPSRGSAQARAITTTLSEIVSEVSRAPARGAATVKPIAEEGRLKIVESVTTLLRLVSEDHPLLLILDNLHCADVPSLQLLQFVSREMSGRRIAIIGSHRESAAETGGALRETLGALASQSFFEGIPLSGWDPGSVGECLRGSGIANPPSQLVQAVHGRTEGNPLFVLEVARLLQQRGLADIGAEPNTRPWETYIPQKIRLAILGLFERLTVPCRNALAAGAIIGREFESSLLSEIALEAGPIEAVLEEALAHGLIEETAEKAGHYRFTHALVQDAVKEQTTGPRRTALHLKTAEALERRSGQEDLAACAGELARHFDASGSERAEKAILYFRMAGERALRMCAYEDAHEQLRRALELGGGKIQPLDRARLLFGLAQSQHGLGRVVVAAENHAQAFDLFVRNGDIDNAVHIFEQPLIMMEKPVHLTPLIEKAISLVGASSLRGESLGGKYGLGVYHDTGDYLKAVPIFERAARSARQSGDRHQEMSALANWGRIEIDELHFERACELEDQALRVSMESGDLWIEAVGRASICVALLGLGRILEAEKQSALLIALADRLQTRLWTAISSVTCASVQRQKCELRQAREITDKALASSEVVYLVRNRANRVLLDYEAGEPARAAELLQQVVADADQAELPFHWEGLLALLIPYIAWVTGEPLPLSAAEAAARKVPLFGGMRQGDAVTVSVGLGLIAAIRKDRKAAERHYTELLPLRGLVVCPYQGLAADHILGVLASTSGDAPRAQEHFDSALAFCRANGLMLELAYTCRDYGEFLLHAAGKTETQKILDLHREASLVAEQAGLVRLTERLEKLRSAVNEGKPGRREYPDSLSEREVDVLRLLSEGLSNAQIGERLFISLHTVANHVQSILEKTGAANRTEAALYAIRHHLAEEQP